MNNPIMESIVESLFFILPLFKKKLMKPEETAEENDLSASHYQILFLLEDLGRQPISEIGKNLYISKPNMTPLVQRLIDRALVERIRNVEDRRYINIGITPKGKEIIDGHKMVIAQNLKKKLSNLSNAELERLSSSLQDVKEILSKIE